MREGSFHLLKLCAVWFAAIFFLTLNLVWLFHTASPWRWLQPGEVTFIQNVIGAIWIGKLAILLERYANKHSDDD